MAYTPALVIQKDTYILNNSNGTFGQIQLIPTPMSGGMVDGDYWATPVTDNGIVGTGFTYTPAQPGDVLATAPDIQSFHVVRIIMQTNQSNISTTWWVVGNSSQYILSAADAEVGHASPPVLMPQTLAAFVPSQTLCLQDANGAYFAVLGAPTLGAGAYFVKGYLNGVALPAASPSGYATADLLLTFLNTATTGWAAVGTWTKTADNLTFIATQTSGSGTDVLSAAITII